MTTLANDRSAVAHEIAGDPPTLLERLLNLIEEVDDAITTAETQFQAAFYQRLGPKAIAEQAREIEFFHKAHLQRLHEHKERLKQLLDKETRRHYG